MSWVRRIHGRAEIGVDISGQHVLGLNLACKASALRVNAGPHRRSSAVASLARTLPERYSSGRLAIRLRFRILVDQVAEFGDVASLASRLAMEAER